MTVLWWGDKNSQGQQVQQGLQVQPGQQVQQRQRVYTEQGCAALVPCYEEKRVPKNFHMISTSLKEKTSQQG